MSYRLYPVGLELPTRLTHRCWLHATRDGYLIGVIAFESPAVAEQSQTCAAHPLLAPDCPASPSQTDARHGSEGDLVASLVTPDAHPADASRLQWFDLEYMRRRTEELALMPFPDLISALIIDLRAMTPLLDSEAPIFPWRLTDEECPIRILVHAQQRAHYSAVFEPAWLAWDLPSTLHELRDFFDMDYH